MVVIHILFWVGKSLIDIWELWIPNLELQVGNRLAITYGHTKYNKEMSRSRPFVELSDFLNVPECFAYLYKFFPGP